MTELGSCMISLVVCAGALLAHEPSDINSGHSGLIEKVHGCWHGADGVLEGGVFSMPIDEDALRIRRDLEEARRGIADNRVDFVIVGDGYTASEQDQFHADAASIASSFFRYEPFITYKPYFRITEIGVISNESGVDNDPVRGIERDTALDMEYWCFNTERLLCVDVAKAYQAAAGAPDIDQVIAIANSTKYGGAGYPASDLATAAGRNFYSVDVAIHEMGHSMGDLADEYSTGGPADYSGNEPVGANSSVFERDVMLTQRRKWWRWMDESMPGFDGIISTYEGSSYSQNGVYRPSGNSMMRSLGRPFNLPSAERLIREIYSEVRPIDDGTADGAELGRDSVAWVRPMQPDGHDLSVTWYVNDQVVLSASGESVLELSTLPLLDGVNTIRVEVVDPTPWVRDEWVRDNLLTESRTYTVPSCFAADMDGDGVANFIDVILFLDAYYGQDPSADLNGDSLYNFHDVSAFISDFVEGCL